MTMSDMPQRAEAGDQGANQSAASPRGPRAETPKRRTFTAAYKRRIIQQYDALTDPTERGALPCLSPWSETPAVEVVPLQGETGS